MKNVEMLLMVVLVTISAYATVGDVWNVKTDWMDDVNQTTDANQLEPWSYRFGGTGYWGSYGDLYVPRTIQNWSIAAPSYAIYPVENCNAALSSGSASNQDQGYLKDYWWEPNEVGSQGPSMIRWTAPDQYGDGSSYWVEVRGYVYLWAASYYPTWWQLKKNDVKFSDGYTPSPSPTTPNPSIHLYGPNNKAAFADGSGGPEAMIQRVEVGDRIDLIVPDNRGEYFGGMTAINLSIKEVSAPPVVTLTVQISSPAEWPVPGTAVNPPEGVHTNIATGSTVPLSALDPYINCDENGEVTNFSEWQGDVADPASASTTIEMTDNKTVTAVFVDGRQCGDQCHPYPEGDLTMDCIVSFPDLAYIAQRWLNDTRPDGIISKLVWTGLENEYGAVSVTSDNQYIYAALATAPSKVVKIDRGTMQTVSSWTGEAGQNSPYAVLTNGDYIYVSLRTLPGKVVKINKDTMTTVSVWTGVAGEDYAKILACDGDYIYVSIYKENSNPAVVVKIDCDTMTTTATWTGAIGEAWCQGVCSDGTYIYAGLDLQPFEIIKINPATMQTVSKYVPSGSLPEPGYSSGVDVSYGLHCYDGHYIYVSTYGNPVRLYKISTDMQYVDSYIGQIDVVQKGTVVASNGDYTYIALDMVPGKLPKINNITMTLADTYTGIDGEQHFYYVALDDAYVYFTSYSTPARVIRIEQ